MNKVRAYKKFANKLWNIARFVYSQTEDFDFASFDPSSLGEEETRLINQWEEMKQEVSEDIDHYRLYLAAEKLYHYVWHTFADHVLESSKAFTEPETRLITNPNTQYVLLYIMRGFIKCLHPFMPFITSEIWKDFPVKEREMLLIEPW